MSLVSFFAKSWTKYEHLFELSRMQSFRPRLTPHLWHYLHLVFLWESWISIRRETRSHLTIKGIVVLLAWRSTRRVCGSLFCIVRELNYSMVARYTLLEHGTRSQLLATCRLCCDVWLWSHVRENNGLNVLRV